MKEKQNVKLAVVYHSGYGHTKVQAEHIVKGATSVAYTHVELIPVQDVTSEPNVLTPYDTMIFGCPTYMGSASSVFKLFIENTSRFFTSRDWRGKIAAGFTNSHSHSGDKVLTLLQLMTFAAQQGMIWVSLPDVNKTDAGEGSLPSGHPDGINRLGGSVGLMSQSDHGASAPPHGDLTTAENFGKYLAEVTLRWHGT